MGRRKGWNDERKERIADLFSKGNTRGEIAKSLGLTMGAFDTLLSRNPELRPAKDESTVRQRKPVTQAKQGWNAQVQQKPVEPSWPTDEDVIRNTCRQFGVIDDGVVASILVTIKAKIPIAES